MHVNVESHLQDQPVIFKTEVGKKNNASTNIKLKVATPLTLLLTSDRLTSLRDVYPDRN